MKLLTSKILKSYGFSLVEVMVAMGVLGAGALTYMQIQKNNISANKRSEARLDVNSLATNINTALIDEKACENTFSGVNFSGVVGTVGTIPDIKDGTTTPGRVLFGTGTVVENSIDVSRYEYEITTALTAPTPPATLPEGDMYGEFKVSFFYQNSNKSLENNNTYKKTLEQNYKVFTDAAGNLLSCYSDTDGMVTQNVKQACESIGGNFSDTLMVCDLTVKTFNPSNPAAGLDDVQQFEGISYGQFATNIIPGLLDGSFLRIDGANTMDGTLRVRNYLKLSQDPVEDQDTIPKKYMDERFSCPSGQTGFYRAETGLVCKTIACNDPSERQQYLVGIDGDGDPICNPLVSGDEEKCTTGKLRAQADGSVKYECCTPSCGNPANKCSGILFESSNECGQCVGTKPLQNASWSTWSDTGDFRNVGGCVAGLQQLEKRQTRTCDEAQQCGGVTCSGNSERWVDAGTQTCTPPRSCTSSCDCANSFDVCEGNICVDRSNGTCREGTFAKGDTSCQYLCGSGGAWTCPASGQTCSPKGMCQGFGSDSANLIVKAYEDEVRNGCRTQYRDVYIDINVANFKRGNIYSVHQGHAFTAEVNPGDTPQTVLQRIANKINAANMTYPTLCNGAGSTVTTRATVISSNRMKYHINWQHQPAISGSRSCNTLDELTCGSTPGCDWKTDQDNYCTGWNYQTEQGTCSGTYNQQACVWNGMGGSTYGGGFTPTTDGGGSSGGGGDPGCEYKYYDQASCNTSAASAEGCFWGTKSQSCYGTNQTSCRANGGSCYWTPGPSRHQSCTQNTYESGCTSAGSACTWGPPL